MFKIYITFYLYLTGKVSKLNVSTHIVSTNSVLLKWAPFSHYEYRTLLGYVIYYLEAPSKNVSLYDGRDACGGDGLI